MMTPSERIHMARSVPRASLQLLRIVFCCISLAVAAGATDPLQCADSVLAAPAASEQPKPSPSEKIGVDPTQLDVKVYSADDTATITIQNYTATAIDELRFSSLGLLDGKAGIRIPAWNWRIKLAAPLKPNERTDCTLRLPTSNDAGAFTGIMRVQGAGREVSVPLTLRMRGPYLPYWNGFPLLLLTAVFLCGWTLSLWMDSWYTNRLPRVQQVLLLREQQDALNNFLSELTTWEKDNKATLSRTVGTATFDKSDIETTLKRVNSIDLVSLQQAVQRFDLACRLNDEFWTALQIAKETLPNNLPQIGTQLDLVARGTDPSLYRSALLQVLTTPIMPMAAAAIAPGLVVAVGGGDLSHATSAGLHSRVLAMDVLKACVLAVIVWITAFTVYYYPNPSFGSVIDYLTLFIWSLGLTTTGAQLIGSVRRP
jgi:hypothetical protein